MSFINRKLQKFSDFSLDENATLAVAMRAYLLAQGQAMHVLHMSVTFECGRDPHTDALKRLSSFGVFPSQVHPKSKLKARCQP